MIFTPYARVIYTSTGTVQNYNVPFPYLDFDDIHIFAIDPDTRKRTTEIAVSEWITGSTIKPASVPPSGQKFMIERVTPRDAALVDYANGAVIEADDLDLGVLQNLYICEELIDELEWTGNEVSLLWAAHAQLTAYYEALRRDHDGLDARETNHYNLLTAAIAELRTALEETDTTANAALNLGKYLKCWLHRWYEIFLPAIQEFIAINIIDGGTAATIDEITVIIDGGNDVDEIDFETDIIYDGESCVPYTYAWTPEALKLMHAYECSSIALAQARQARKEVEELRAQLQAIYNSLNNT